MYVIGDRVTSPAGHKATVTDVRDHEVRGTEAHVRFDDPMRVPGWFTVDKLSKEES